jgi:hypothetical protein
VDAILELVDRYHRPADPEPTPPESPRDGLREVSLVGVTVEGYKAEDGALWVRLGVFPELPDEPPQKQSAGPRTCTRCGREQPLSRFRWNGRARTSRRRQCMDCENVIKRQRAAEKKAGKH